MGSSAPFTACAFARLISLCRAPLPPHLSPCLQSPHPQSPQATIRSVRLVAAALVQLSLLGAAPVVPGQVAPPWSQSPPHQVCAPASPPPYPHWLLFGGWSSEPSGSEYPAFLGSIEPTTDYKISVWLSRNLKGCRFTGIEMIVTSLLPLIQSILVIL